MNHLKQKDFSQFFEQNSKIKNIAVVGKMASGKNFICQKLELFGFKSVDADILVHQAIEKSASQIEQTFGDEAKKQNLKIVNDDGKINRRELGKLLFKNPKLMQKQEQILYPVVQKMTEDFILENEKSITNATVLYKIPQLLLRSDVVFYVKSSFFKRFFRARKRDNLSILQILRRFYSQRFLLKKYKKICKNIVLIKN